MRHKENGRGLSTLISLAFSSPQLLYSEIKRHPLIEHNSPGGRLQPGFCLWNGGREYSVSQVMIAGNQKCQLFMLKSPETVQESLKAFKRCIATSEELLWNSFSITFGGAQSKFSFSAMQLIILWGWAPTPTWKHFTKRRPAIAAFPFIWCNYGASFVHSLQTGSFPVDLKPFLDPTLNFMNTVLYFPVFCTTSKSQCNYWFYLLVTYRCQNDAQNT